MSWYMNEDPRDDDNEKAIKKIFLIIIAVILVIALGVSLWLKGT